MAKIRNNNILKGVSGKLGNNIVIKEGKSGQYMANTPKERKRSSPKQLVQMSSMGDASRYAKRSNKNPERRALYAKGITRKKFSAYHVAVADYMNAPEIHAIEPRDYAGNPGDLIRFRVTDDFRVAAVSVTLERPDGSIIESGNATPRGKRGLWRWQVTTKNEVVEGTVIKVVATDHAGNKTTGNLTLGADGLILTQQ